MNHPIDRFFKEKLENFEKTPPAAVWEKIAGVNRVPAKKTGPRWYLMAAASILLILVFAIFFMQERTISQEQISDKQPIKVEKEISKQERVSEENKTTTEKKVKEETVTQTHPVKKTGVIKKKVKNQREIIQTPVPKSDLLAKEEKKDIPVIEVEKQREVNEGPIKEDIEIIIIRGSENMALAESEIKSETKTGSNIARVYKQIKKLKNGEKVNLKELVTQSGNLLLISKKDKRNSTNN